MLLLNPLMAINMSPLSSLEGVVLHALLQPCPLQPCQLFHVLGMSAWLSLHPHPYHSCLPLGHLVPLARCLDASREVLTFTLLTYSTDWEAQRTLGLNGLKQHCMGYGRNGHGLSFTMWQPRPRKAWEGRRGEREKPRLYSSWLRLRGLQGCPLGGVAPFVNGDCSFISGHPDWNNHTETIL